MARIRSVHPSLFTDEAWVSCSPLARLLFIGLWTDADDQGVFEWKPLQIKMRLLPGDAADAATLLAELEASELLKGYTHEGKRFGVIRNFRRFQRPKKPNSVHVLPDEFRTYVGLSGDGSEHGDAEGDAVPHQFPTSGEKSPQMEDGGGRKEEEGKKEEDANASFVGEPTPKPARKPKPPKRRTYPMEFEAAWAAYPHHEGRSSKAKALIEWERLPSEERDGLLGAIGAFIPKVATACGSKGAPGMHVWLSEDKHLNWMAEPEPPPEPPVYDGPPELREWIAKHAGEEFAAMWVDSARYHAAPRVLVTRSGVGRDKINQDCWSVLAKARVKVIGPKDPMPKDQAA